MDLNNFHNEPVEVQQAIAFYVSCANPPRAEREKHYKVLENAGFLERVGESNGEDN
jgi:surfactin synthase thioesterase subunit